MEVQSPSAYTSAVVPVTGKTGAFLRGNGGTQVKHLLKLPCVACLVARQGNHRSAPNTSKVCANMATGCSF